jgi:hypothetical protein
MPIHPASLEAEKLLAECEVTRTRRGGPGGQHRNKVETAIVILHRTGISAEAGERRSQIQNKHLALFRLRVNLALAIRTPPAATGPTALWRSRCQAGRIVLNPSHEDFPAILAEALDAIVAKDWDLKSAAEYLDCSMSQLLKLLKMDPRGLALVNNKRLKRNQPLLK